MKNQSLFRYGGIAAIISAVLYVLSLGIGFAGITGVLSTTVYAISSLLFVAVLVVLYMDLRTGAALTALTALILMGGSTIWSLFIDPTIITPVIAPLTFAYGIGTALFGWLQRGNSRYPNGIGFLGIVTGVIGVIAGIVLMAGASFDIFGLLNLILTVPYVIWLVWLGTYYMKGKSASLQAA